MQQAARGAGEADGGVKEHGLPAHAAQLGAGALVAAGFAQGLAVQVGHLVGADDQRLRMVAGHVLGFGPGQSQGQLARGFAGQGGFIDGGGLGFKGQAQSGQQFAPIGRGGGEDEGGGHGGGRSGAYAAGSEGTSIAAGGRPWRWRWITMRRA